LLLGRPSSSIGMPSGSEMWPLRLDSPATTYCKFSTIFFSTLN
jgi:hypothetical protein